MFGKFLTVREVNKAFSPHTLNMTIKLGYLKLLVVHAVIPSRGEKMLYIKIYSHYPYCRKIPSTI